MCIRDSNKILLGMKRECENYTVYDTFGNMVFSFMRLMTLLDEFLPVSYTHLDVYKRQIKRWRNERIS